MLGRPGHLAGGRGGADVERQDVVADRSAVGAADLPRTRIEPHRACLDEARPGRRGEALHVDVRVLEPVQSRHEAGQHPRIRREPGPGDDDQRDAGRGTPREGPQHLDVGVTRPDQHDRAAVLRRVHHRGRRASAPTRRRAAGPNTVGLK